MIKKLTVPLLLFASMAFAQSFPAGTRLRLTAMPDSGAAFQGWSGGVTGTTNPLEIVLDADTTITATFSGALPPPPPQDPTLTVTVVGPGAVSVEVVPSSPPPDGVWDLLAANLPPPGQFKKPPNSEIGSVLTGTTEFPFCNEINCFSSHTAFTAWVGMALTP